MLNTSFVAFEAKLIEASNLLGMMANATRLAVLCHLLKGERSVGELAAIVDLSPSALSQHLAKMRACAMVETRRDGLTIYYRLASREAREILSAVAKIYGLPPP